MIATSPADVLRFLLTCADRGLGTVLVTLTGIEKGSSRAIGSQMAVAEDGRYAGSFSGGCIEAAVVGEAIDCLRQDRATLVRFGLDSRYLDIRLPCGGGVDLFFSPQPEPAVIADTLSRLEAREPAALSVTEGGVRMVHVVGDGGWQGEGFEVVYLPPLRIVAIGQGEDLTAFVRLAHRFGADVTALSPSQIDVDLLSGEGIETFELVSRTSLPSIRSDAWTAIVLLFHDHDWEETLLPHALNLPAFYFGAVGSRRTHQARLEMLRLAGVPERLQAALRGPGGLIPATRDPATLALSILAEVVSEYQRMIAPTKGPALAAS